MHYRTGNAAPELRFLLFITQVLIDEIHLIDTFVLMVKNLNNLLTAYCFFNISVYSADSSLLLYVIF